MHPFITFTDRHIGPNSSEKSDMLSALDLTSMDSLIEKSVPVEIRSSAVMDLPDAFSEAEALAELSGMMDENVVLHSLIGQGYYGTITPPVIQRNILENPGWYTAYTPYQAEIAQGRLEALLNYQTMVCDLTGLAVSNASLLDEGTAAAEAMSLALASKPKGTTFFVSEKCHPQTIAVLRTRAEPLGITLEIGDWQSFSPAECEGLFAAIIQYPDTEGRIDDFSHFTEQVHAAKALVIVATDLLALTLLKPPGEWGADIAVGSAQRFGVPMGYGGPHAGFISCTDKLKRKLPGRLIGVSKDSQGKPAYRLALQTREQHIRRDKATSNICTAQVLLAVMASMYAVYHGPAGLKAIATEVNRLARRFAQGLESTCLGVEHDAYFDTVTVVAGDHCGNLIESAEDAGFNLRRLDDDRLCVSFDETVTDDEVEILLDVFAGKSGPEDVSIPSALIRESEYLLHPVFHAYHSETEMLRYMKRLESKDLALNESMIPLGSCTMKLNATAEMMPVTWPEVSMIHPFAPIDQASGYLDMLNQLSHWLAEITGFADVSLQPNAGSQGEYAGLLAIRRFHLSQKGADRTVCLIPMSAHGTNPASAVMTGFQVVGVACDEVGNIDMTDLRAKCAQHSDKLGALMVTYPSTHGVFEETIIEICNLIHQHGGQVYMDGANMNAQVGLTSPGHCGADVCHLNLHKTFCIPHGGGGPGVGPIGVAAHLVPFLPGHALLDHPEDAVSSAPYGSASINVISWMYIAMMGTDGLTEATRVSILNANYVAKRLDPYFPVLYKGKTGMVAHECIIDVRPLAAQSGITVEDVAKRLMDYGYHSPTMSWPVAGTLMIEPTESESKAELDRFCDAMISIHREIIAIVNGEYDREDNPLKNAPHTTQMVTTEEWQHGYSRQMAAFPMECLREHKFWPAVGRIDNVHGDRNLVCTCEPMEHYQS